MDFEWDERKRLINIEKHGVDFRLAALIFEGFVSTYVDDRHDYGEDRFISLGLCDDDCYVVVHTDRSDVVRIISAWKGGRDERNQYDKDLAGRASEEEGPG